jgi:hypothetical protein
MPAPNVGPPTQANGSRLLPVQRLGVPPRSGDYRPLVALIVTAGARFLLPFFATDQQGSRFQTPHGIVHMILAVIA